MNGLDIHSKKQSNHLLGRDYERVRSRLEKVKTTIDGGTVLTDSVSLMLNAHCMLKKSGVKSTNKYVEALLKKASLIRNQMKDVSMTLKSTMHIIYTE